MSNFSIDSQNLLRGENVQHLSCPKNNSKFQPGNLDTLVIHYTAGRDALSSAKYLARDDIKASAHLVIGRGGEVYQIVPFDTISWHAGRSSYMGRSGYNNYSIGIELDNAGPLTKTGTEYSAWFKKKYMESEVVHAVHRNEKSPRYWHEYTQEQLAVCEDISKLLVDHYGLKHILGHEEISPGRKQDPGPAFPLDRMRDRILSYDRKSDTGDLEQSMKGETIPPKLNIRSGPSAGSSMVANPLIAGSKVKILEEQNGWYRVTTQVEGWVSKGYVKLNK